jgi:hypothetical protein
MYRNAPSPEKHLLLAASATLDPSLSVPFWRNSGGSSMRI